MSPGQPFVSPAATAPGPNPVTAGAYRDPTMRPPAALCVFGFGGRLVTMFPRRKQKLGFSDAIADDGQLRKGPIRVRAVADLLPEYLAGSARGFPGPLAQAHPDSVRAFLDEQVQEALAAYGSGSSQALMVQLLRIAASPQNPGGGPVGFRSEKPTDPESPESRMALLLSDAHPNEVPTPTSQALDSCRAKGGGGGMVVGVAAQVEGVVSKMLARGDREAALEAAIGGKAWALALVIASVCSQERYREVVRLFADDELTHGAPAHTMALVFSGQTEAVAQGGKSLFSAQGSGAATLLLHQWRLNLAGLLSNRASGWRNLMNQLGDRLASEQQDFAAAACAALISGEPPPHVLKGLLGVGPGTALDSHEGLRAQRLSEVLEWCLGGPCPAMQPAKLQFATLLAERGDGPTGAAYARVLRAAVAAEGGKGGLSKGYLQDLLLFEDRIFKLTGESRSGKAVATDARQGDKGPSQAPGGGLLGRLGKAVLGGLENITAADDDASAAGPSPGPGKSTGFGGGNGAGGCRPAAISTGAGPKGGPQEPTMAGPGTRTFTDKQDSLPSEPTKAPEPPSPGMPRSHSTPTVPSAAAPVAAKTTPKASTGPSLEKKGWLASKFTKWMHPDAAEATMGGEMEAYFDKDLGRWVFPGEDPAEATAAAAPPPPPPSMGPSHSSTPNLSASPSDDPLAALMAVPRRSTVPASNDPLASLMAPPQRAMRAPASAAPASKGTPPMFFNPAAAKK